LAPAVYPPPPGAPPPGGPPDASGPAWFGGGRVRGSIERTRERTRPEGTDVATTDLTTNKIEQLLGDEASSLLEHTCETISADQLHLPGPDFIDRLWLASDRSSATLRNLQWLFDHGRLAGTGYVSILPVDQGIEHSAGASFAPNPIYFDPENLVRLAIEGGCNAIASTLGVLGAVSRTYAHKLPFILKLNHNELLSYPNEHDQIMFSSVKRAWDMGAVGVGATIYFGSPESRRQLVEVSKAFEQAHELGMFTVLWCYLRSPGFKVDGTDYGTAADLTGQANHLGVTIEADIIKQKLPENNGGYKAVQTQESGYGKIDDRIYTELTTDNPIDLTRYQVVNCYMGRAGLINSGGASSGQSDMAEAVRTAVINKRAGGMGLISGRKAFQRPLDEGAELLRAIQDVYLAPEITVA
jgi:class I fructose-bisphosphate aldolase